VGDKAILLKQAEPQDFTAKIPELIWSEDVDLLTLEFHTFEAWVSVARKE
jgi:hypothetical protein